MYGAWFRVHDRLGVSLMVPPRRDLPANGPSPAGSVGTHVGFAFAELWSLVVKLSTSMACDAITNPPPASASRSTTMGLHFLQRLPSGPRRLSASRLLQVSYVADHAKIRRKLTGA